MKDARFASGITTVLAVAMLAGCVKQEAASTSEPTPAGDATTAPENDAGATASDDSAAPREAPVDAEAAPKD